MEDYGLFVCLYTGLWSYVIGGIIATEDARIN